MKNAEWIIKNGYKFSDLHCSYMQPGSICSFYLNDKNVGKVSGLSFFEAIKTWLDAEHVEPILDDVERRYLSAVIRPFRVRVQYIAKSFADDARFYRINCYIFIHFNDGSDDMDFPLFNESKMYKGMAINRPYTLKELGL